MKDFQFITNSHPSYVENLYNDYLKDPASVDQEFKKFFEGFDFAVNHQIASKSPSSSSQSVSNTQLSKELAVFQLIEAYRKKGHLVATTNPIRPRKNRNANLELSYFGLSDADLELEFEVGNSIGLGKSSLKNILSHLQKCYTSHIGVDFGSITDNKKIDWLIQSVEQKMTQPIPIDQKKRILQKLNEGVMFEKFLHTKYIGQKRFSLEGGETTIAALDAILNVASNNQVEEIVIGMAHRGRLNVLANILGKTYEEIFNEFEGNALPDTTMGSGDVKYHLGFSSDVQTFSGNKVRLKLCPNPSHLEAVNPVVIGYARSKSDVLYESNSEKILPILIHGDASVAGQGIVYEVLQMSKLNGYHVGGTIHYVINNQIGFTTDFDDARSSDYCTSIAALVQAPVFHVNGDDPEAVVKAVEIATMYRQQFKSDIFIDMVCYRRHGHNEGDEPKFTQPQLYSLIDKHLNQEKYIRNI